MNKDRIIEYESINPECLSITKNPCESGYVLHSFRDAWVFPFVYKKIAINIGKIYLPDYTIGIIHEKFKGKLKVRTEFIDDNTLCYIEVKSASLSPIKIHKEEGVALMDIVSSNDCFLVKRFERNNNH